MAERRASHQGQKAGLTRAIVIDAARKIVAAEGHEALSLRRLAKDLGVTAPALYVYVDDKEALLKAIVRQDLANLIEVYEAIDDPDPIERLRRISHQYVRWVRDNPELYRVLLLFPPELFRRQHFDPAAEARAFGSRLFHKRAEAVAEAIELGSLRDDDPYLLNLTMFCAVIGVSNFLLMEPELSPAFETHLVDTVIDAVLAGLHPAAGTLPSSTPEGPRQAPRRRTRRN